MTTHTAIATEFVQYHRADLQRQAVAARLARQAAHASPRGTSRRIRPPERTQFRRALADFMAVSVR